MKFSWIIYGGMIVLSSCSAKVRNAYEYVDPFIGTDAHGHTFPGATVPFGAVQLSPDTRTMGWDASSGYHYSDSTIIGFSHTHLSGTGCSDLADILFRPVSGDDIWKPLAFSHKDEKAAPGYYCVFFKEEGLLSELTATTHCGIHRYTYKEGAPQKMVIDLKHSLDKEGIQRAEISQTGANEIRGMRSSDGWIKGQNIYFVVQFSKDINRAVFYRDSIPVALQNKEMLKGQDLKVLLGFDEKDTSPLVCKVGISSVSCDNALGNLKSEAGKLSFDAIRGGSEQVWKDKLACIQVSGQSKENIEKFYTALYHTLIVPNETNDVNGQYAKRDNTKGQLSAGQKAYSTLSLWDTFRTWNPLMTLIDTTVVSNMIQSMFRTYDETGELPVWPLCNGETYCMIGYHSVSVIADAYSKGIRGFDVEKALKAMKESAAKDRKGTSYFNKLGFIPSDKSDESVSCLLEYCYDDWCIAQYAKAIGHNDDYTIYMERSLNYKNIFDKNTRFFRPKLLSGEWKSPFDAYKINSAYTEATPWQYRFFVPHDVNGLIRLLGGPSFFEATLDSIFIVPPTIDPEIPDISGSIGQYVHGNEPSHGIAYLYSYIGQSWKTQKWTRQLLDEMYQAKPDGICGNEDCGQMSAWFIMSSLGLYPECPGSNEFVLTSPLFEKAVIQLANGNNLTITANNPEKSVYINEVYLNGKKLDTTFVSYEQIIQGGTLKFVLSAQPNKKRDATLKAPYSYSFN